MTPPSAAAVVLNLTAVEPTRPGVHVRLCRRNRPAERLLTELPVASARRRLDGVRGVESWARRVLLRRVPRARRRGGLVHRGAGRRARNHPDRIPARLSNTEVIFISDSSFAGIRWNGALSFLQGAAFDNRLESCRRLFSTSCRGREGYAPLTAVEELSWATPGRYRIAVIATGYNDWASLFPSSFDAVMSVARSKGIDRVRVADVSGERRLRVTVGYLQQRFVRRQQSRAVRRRRHRASTPS